MSTNDVWSLHWLMRHWYQSFASDDVVIIHVISIRHTRYYLISMAPENQGYERECGYMWMVEPRAHREKTRPHILRNIAICPGARRAVSEASRPESCTKKSRISCFHCFRVPADQIKILKNPCYVCPFSHCFIIANYYTEALVQPRAPPSHLYKLQPCPEVAFHFISPAQCHNFSHLIQIFW